MRRVEDEWARAGGSHESTAETAPRRANPYLQRRRGGGHDEADKGCWGWVTELWRRRISFVLMA